tara:strand:+ start:680 stop:853 length:174 start_codon:yes stop_codon:yes gene_type:complete
MPKKLADDYNNGYKAFSKVVKVGKHYHVLANPNRKNTTSAKEWQRGWDKAYLDNLVR